MRFLDKHNSKKTRRGLRRLKETKTSRVFVVDLWVLESRRNNLKHRKRKEGKKEKKTKSKKLEEEQEEEKLQQQHLSLDSYKKQHQPQQEYQQQPQHLSGDVDGGSGGGRESFPFLPHPAALQIPPQFSQDSLQMLFHHHQQQQQQPQHEFHHLKSRLDSSNTPVLQTPTAAAETLTQPLKKRCYRRKPGGGLGEIVEVEGGHILRATGRKDRHSKVCTAKGPRDRRVRLSANTAIQFYDVQDRLGYDRPSKAVDWLMKKAKLAIDELDELPSWTPSATKPSVNDNGTLPPSLESDSIADTIKSFFPLNGAVSEAQSNQFQHYPTGNNSGSQDLKLSLQSFHDPMLIGFDNPSSGWGGGAGGFMLIPPQQQQPPPPPLFHRGPLQSSNTPNSIRAWIAGTSSSDYSIGSSTQDFHQAVSLSSIAAAGFPGYYFPARLQGQQEEHAGIPNKPSSASSPSRL